MKPKTLTYWFALQSSSYNLRRATRAELVAAIAENSHVSWGPITKKVVTYTSPLDLIDQALAEGGFEY